MNETELFKLAAYVLSSGYRERTMHVLHEYEPITPKYIAKYCEYRQNHVSTVLKQLKEHGLVVCLNEEMRKGRLYCLTELGKSVYDVLPRLNGKSCGELE